MKNYELKNRDPTFYEKGPLAAAKIGTQNDRWGIFCNSPILMISIFAASKVTHNNENMDPKVQKGPYREPCTKISTLSILRSFLQNLDIIFNNLDTNFEN